MVEKSPLDTPAEARDAAPPRVSSDKEAEKVNKGPAKSLDGSQHRQDTISKPEPLQTTTTQNSEPQKDYSSFTSYQKNFIVFTATMGAFFSPFSTQIYFPALTSIAKDLGVTNSKINLTVATYMVTSALSFGSG